MNSLAIFSQMLVLFAMMLLGYVARKKDVINSEVSVGLSALVVNVFNPVLIINSVLEGGAASSSQNIAVNFGMIFLYFIIEEKEF